MPKRDCIFCDIIADEAPASVVYRDQFVIVFMDVQPVNAGQVLIVPIRHLSSFSELDATCAGHLMRVAQRVALALRSSDVRCEGINLFLADGAVAMQEVFHVHLHVIPRFEGDGFGFKHGDGNFVLLERASLDRFAASIRSALERVN